MTLQTARVGLARRADRRQNIYRALDLVRNDVTPKLREQVMLKPNFLSSKNQLAASHVDAIRGVLDFLLGDEAQLLAFCTETEIAPELPARLRMALPGGTTEAL